ncbi:HD domain-containing phosphohydrolase [Melioribacter sp. Ez-97]|uniref:HD domain-containing phosphohydrolase n=1 Tax=Melioribacter sp. Ez-97 TaxID=3423434 RepID=UPI003ED9208F
MRTRVLLVDDDAIALAGYKRNLRQDFDIYTAENAGAALRLIENSEPFAVVVSDFKMPGMDGITFLKKLAEIHPDTARIILTGYAELKVAVDAVNEGSVFRFLTKPCNSEQLLNAIKAGARQYELINSEKELLEKTLKGSINILIDILSHLNPQVFKRANKLRDIAHNVASVLKSEEMWEIEMAAILMQIGLVAIPDEIVAKKYNGESLSQQEEELYKSYIEVSGNLLKNIPRLEKVAEIISGGGNTTASQILSAVSDYDALVNEGREPADALELMKKNGGYNEDILAALYAEVVGIYDGLVIKDIKLNDLEIGMVLADDIRDSYNKVLIGKGCEISQVSLIKLKNYARFNKIIEPIKIFDAE